MPYDICVRCDTRGALLDEVHDGGRARSGSSLGLRCGSSQPQRPSARRRPFSSGPLSAATRSGEPRRTLRRLPHRDASTGRYRDASTGPAVRVSQQRTRGALLARHVVVTAPTHPQRLVRPLGVPAILGHASTPRARSAALAHEVARRGGAVGARGKHARRHLAAGVGYMGARGAPRAV
eukprot:7383077-Prymnesium_polylepis.1